MPSDTRVLEPIYAGLRTMTAPIVLVLEG